MAITATTVVMMAISMAIAAKQAADAKKAANAQAEIQRQQAERAQQQANLDAQDFEREQSRKAASSRAQLGGSGVEGGEGSPLLVAEDFAGEVGLNALRIRSGGLLTATRLNQQAALTVFSGKAQADAALLQGVQRSGSLLMNDRKWRAPKSPTKNATTNSDPSGSSQNGWYE